MGNEKAPMVFATISTNRCGVLGKTRLKNKRLLTDAARQKGGMCLKGESWNVCGGRKPETQQLFPDGG